MLAGFFFQIRRSGQLQQLIVSTAVVHGLLDKTVSIELSRSYARAARAAGGDVELVEIEGAAGAHRAHVEPRGPTWGAVTNWLDAPRPLDAHVAA